MRAAHVRQSYTIHRLTPLSRFQLSESLCAIEERHRAFFKDGYTDLRGKFDYASVNSSSHAAPPHPLPGDRGGGPSGLDYQMLAPSELNDVDRLAILILSDAHGATVREVSPPSR